MALLQAEDAVFPAYAGMFRRPDSEKKLSLSFPRIRGDVPDKRTGEVKINEFSPHTRGCSALVR